MFFKRDGGLQQISESGRLYVFRFVLDDGAIIHKVGKASGKSSKERFLQILGSFFDKYRYIPRASIRLDRQVVVPLLVERHIHSLLKEWQYLGLDSKVSGYTEMFTDIDEPVLLDYIKNFDYRELLTGSYKMKIDDYDAIGLELNRLDKESSVSSKENLDELLF